MVRVLCGYVLFVWCLQGTVLVVCMFDVRRCMYTEPVCERLGGCGCGGGVYVCVVCVGACVSVRFRPCVK